MSGGPVFDGAVLILWGASVPGRQSAVPDEQKLIRLGVSAALFLLMGIATSSVIPRAALITEL